MSLVGEEGPTLTSPIDEVLEVMASDGSICHVSMNWAVTLPFVTKLDEQPPFWPYMNGLQVNPLLAWILSVNVQNSSLPTNTHSR